VALESSRNEEDEKREEKAAKNALLLEDIQKIIEKLEAKTAKQGKKKMSSEEAKTEVRTNSTIWKRTKWRPSRSTEEMKVTMLQPDISDPSEPSS
jgi:DNA replication protein DnaD